jgi:PIN domain
MLMTHYRNLPIELCDYVGELLSMIPEMGFPKWDSRRVGFCFGWSAETRPQVRDPSDEMVFEAAINGNADALVTYNVSDFRLAGERFKIPIPRPADLLKKVRP